MKHYLDITLLPDSETSLGFLWCKVYQQIHLMLVENKIGEKDSAIAVSFPHYQKKGFPLGDKLRLLAQTEQELIQLDTVGWLKRLDDYVHIKKSIKTVPNNVNEWVYFKRWHHKQPETLRAQVDKKAEYLSQKNGFDVAEVKTRLLAAIDGMESESKLPFINLASLSTQSELPANQRCNFKLFIEKQQAERPSNNNSLLTCYGLSRRSQERQVAVPWFD